MISFDRVLAGTHPCVASSVPCSSRAVPKFRFGGRHNGSKPAKSYSNRLANPSTRDPILSPGSAQSAHPIAPRVRTVSHSRSVPPAGFRQNPQGLGNTHHRSRRSSLYRLLRMFQASISGLARHFRGSVTRITVPFFPVFSIMILPPWVSTIRREMAKPSPVPFCLVV